MRLIYILHPICYSCARSDFDFILSFWCITHSLNGGTMTLLCFCCLELSKCVCRLKWKLNQKCSRSTYPVNLIAATRQIVSMCMWWIFIFATLWSVCCMTVRWLHVKIVWACVPSPGCSFASIEIFKHLPKLSLRAW